MRAARPGQGLLALLLVAALGLGGCATTAGSSGTGAGTAAAGSTEAGASAPPALVNPADPWERWNRRVYAFNDALDTAVVRPLAETYVKVVPSPVRQAIGNVANNFGDAWSVVNNLLQGKVEGALVSVVRVTTNTVFGLGGLIDIASEAGIDRYKEDLGQTLGHWGVPPGPYLVLPVLGPSSARDTFTLLPDLYVSPTLLAQTPAGQVGVTSLYLLDTRAGLLPATRMLDSIALDKYAFVRDAYLQRRQNDVYDGNPPAPKDPDAEADAPAPAPAAPERARVPSQPAAPAAR